MYACSGCLRYVRATELRCPFCAAPQRNAGPPLLAGLLCMSALGVMPIACAADSEQDQPQCVDGMMLVEDAQGRQQAVACGEDSESSDSLGETTIVDPSYGEGATYAGPDEDSSVDTGPWPDSDTETTTTAPTTETTDTGTSESSTGCAEGTGGCAESSSEGSGSGESGTDSTGREPGTDTGSMDEG